MAKFKKKKSEPTSDAPEKESSKETSDIPEIKSQVTTPKDPPGIPQVSEAERSEKDRKLNVLFWMRVGLAIISGTMATFIFEDIEGEERRWASIGFMIIVFFSTIIIAKSMRMQLPSSDRKKIVTQGIGSYIFMYLFTWILTFTLVNVGNVSSGIPSPLI